MIENTAKIFLVVVPDNESGFTMPTRDIDDISQILGVNTAELFALFLLMLISMHFNFRLFRVATESRCVDII